MRYLLPLLLILNTSLCAYDLPEVFVGEHPAPQLNRQFDYIGLALNEIDDSLGVDDDRLDSLYDLLYNNMFFAVDSAGGITIPASDTVQIPFDKVIVKDAAYRFSVGSYSVYINQDGLYELSYSVGVVLPSYSPETSGWIRVYRDGWSDLPGSYLVGNRGPIYAKEICAELRKGDSIAVWLGNKNPFERETYSDGVVLKIKRIR